MIRKIAAPLVCAVLLATAGCTKRGSQPKLLVEIPTGFSGNFVLEMGVRQASPLPAQGNDYVVLVPQSGKVETSTYIEKPEVTFKNASDGRVWGYSQSVWTTGDGIPVGGKIEFFVGTQKEFDAEQQKKNHSGGRTTAREAERSGM